MTFGRRYHNFVELYKYEQEGDSYHRELVKLMSTFVIIAPHGGGIEPGTSEITRAIAGTRFSYYIFDGLKRNGNERLHITSTLFDEPMCLQLVRESGVVVAIHGCEGTEEVIYVGGLHDTLKNELLDGLLRAGFDARVADQRYSGTQFQNVCNQGRSGRGVQLELSQGLRRTMFQAFDREGRKITTDAFWRFVGSIFGELVKAEDLKK